METPSSNPLTELLVAVNKGDSGACDKLWSVVYDELRSLARGQLAAEATGRTLQPTTLVHEAYFRLFGRESVQWANRRHFFGAAAKAMRRIRIDDARKRNRLKRGAGQRPIRITDSPAVFDQDPTELLAVGEALDRLEQKDPGKAEIVMLKYFGGLTGDETASALEISPRTVDKEWRMARAWLHRELSKGDTDAGHD